MAVHPLQAVSSAASAQNQAQTPPAQRNRIEVSSEQTAGAVHVTPLQSQQHGASIREPSSPPVTPFKHQSQRSANKATSANQRRPEGQRHELHFRDSQVRRDDLVKGREGTRRRQRWENDHLLSNPWAQPPLPCDWEIRPTHTRHDPLPYFLASLWDAEQAERKTTELKKEKTKKNDQFRSDGNHATEAARQRIPKLVRDRLKRARAAKGLLMDLEEQVRKFAKEWKATEVAGDHEAVLNRAEFHDFDFLSSEEEEEEEIVFVGRGGSMHDRPMSREGEGLRVRGLVPEKLVFDSLASDHGASFGRWLVHSLATYYELRTWSITTDDTPARREAYVGIQFGPTATTGIAKKTAPRRVAGKDVGAPTGGRGDSGLHVEAWDDWLPSPLWGMV